MVKLLMLITSLAGGGAEKVASDLNLNFSKNIQRIIITLRSEISYPINEPLLSMNLNFIYHNLIDRLMKYIYFIIIGSIKYRKFVKEYNPDISLSFLTLDNFINIFSNIGIKNIKVIISVHGVTSMEFNKSIRDRLTKFMIKILYNKADLVITVSRGVKEELIREFNITPEKIRMIYNPVDIEKIQYLANEKVKDEWFNDDLPIIINMGRLVEQKGQWHLIKAFSKVRERKQCRLVIRGNGELKPYLENLVRDLDLENDVKFLGWQDNPFKYISKSSIFVLSSLWESFGLVIIEAMACGCPVISTDCKYGPSEILENGKFGVLIPPLDGKFYKTLDQLTPEEHFLADEIVKLLEDNNLRTWYSNKGIERAWDFDINQSLREYEKIIRD